MYFNLDNLTLKFIEFGFDVLKKKGFIKCLLIQNRS